MLTSLGKVLTTGGYTPAQLTALAVDFSAMNTGNGTPTAPHLLLLQLNPEGDYTVPTNLLFGTVPITATVPVVKDFLVRAVNINAATTLSTGNKGVKLTSMVIQRNGYPTGTSAGAPAALLNDFTVILDSNSSFAATPVPTTWANLPTGYTGDGYTYNSFPVAINATPAATTITFTSQPEMKASAMDDFHFKVLFKPRANFTNCATRTLSITFYGIVDGTTTPVKLGSAIALSGVSA